MFASWYNLYAESNLFSVALMPFLSTVGIHSYAVCTVCPLLRSVTVTDTTAGATLNRIMFPHQLAMHLYMG